jgi:cytochrome P450
MLGIPEADHHLLRPWSADICKMYELDPSEPSERDAVRASGEFSEYLRRLSRHRRARPGDDLISALSQVLDQGDTLTEDELIGTCVLLLNAGHEATVNVTTIGWRSLFRNPGELARLRADPSLLPTAVEELMRFDTPLQMFERWACSTTPGGWTSAGRRTRTCRSAPASTSAWARRSHGSSCRPRSPPCCVGCRGWSSRRSHGGSRTT